MLEMVVDRRHPEHALAGALVDQNTWMTTLTRLEHEQPADDHQHEFVVGRDRDRAERAAQREAAGVAHEHRRRRRVEPQEGEPRADDRQQQHGQVARARAHAGCRDIRRSARCRRGRRSAGRRSRR